MTINQMRQAVTNSPDRTAYINGVAFGEGLALYILNTSPVDKMFDASVDQDGRFHLTTKKEHS